MQTYVGDIVTNVRSDSRNEDIPSTTEDKGINNNDLVRYCNYAQRRLQNKILKKYPRNFKASSDITVAVDTASYAIPDNVYLGTRIIKVEFSTTGTDGTFQRVLPNPNHFSRGYSYPVSGFYYERDSTGVKLIPTPKQAGTLRVFYERSLDVMALKAATISSHTDSGTQITAITLSTTGDEVALLDANQYLCVSDKDGTVTMYNIPYTSYDDGTGVVTLSAFTYATGESITNGDYVTVGKYSTTHSKLVDDAQDYIELYAVEKAFARDSDQLDMETIKADRRDLEKALVDAYKIADKDPSTMHVIDYEMMLGMDPVGRSW